MNKDKSNFGKFFSSNIKPFLVALVAGLIVFIVFETTGITKL